MTAIEVCAITSCCIVLYVSGFVVMMLFFHGATDPIDDHDFPP